MARPHSQKAATPLFLFLYAAALVLSASCLGGSAVSPHSHHPPPAADHFSGCLLDCETAAAERVSSTLPLFFLFFFGFSRFFLISFRTAQVAWKTHDRAPPHPFFL
ncbi:MAG: hypothetical protein EPO39_04105 [Candidatus Manganitrophaceae bacterium]|nr:MAG: hypothetical protein EPO39_04105 [Candidatus Manganitrophaceae bacterium]